MKALKILAIVLVLLVIGALVAPWKQWVESGLKRTLAQKGISGVDFTVDALGFKGIGLKNITFADTLTLDEMTVAYSVRELISGQVQELTASELVVRAGTQEIEAKDVHVQFTPAEKPGSWQGEWSVGALDVKDPAFPWPPLTGKGTFTADQEQASVKGDLYSEDQTHQAALDADYKFGGEADSSVKLVIAQTEVPLSGKTYSIRNGEVTATGKGADWKGNWKADTLTVEGMEYPLPPVSGKGTMDASASQVNVQGSVQSADHTHQASFVVHYKPENAAASKAIISQAKLPWNGGVLSVKNGEAYFSGKHLFRGTVHLQNIALDTLLRSLTGDKAGATGVLTGSVPVVIEADGTFIIKDGTLQAPDDGTIKLEPDALPGDNKQIEMVRNALGNFQYSELSMSVASDEQKKLNATLKLEGRNPDFFDGRPVKLNVHLTGDVLSLLQQSVPTLTDPKHLLKNR